MLNEGAPTTSQISFSDAEHAGKRKKTRREVFLVEMELVVPWKALLKVIEPHYPKVGTVSSGCRGFQRTVFCRAASNASMGTSVVSFTVFTHMYVKCFSTPTSALNMRSEMECRCAMSVAMTRIK